MVKRIVEVWGADIQATVQEYSLRDDETTVFKGVTPLFIAALNKNTETVRYLVEKGADVSVGASNNNEDCWNFGMTPLHAAFFLTYRISSKASDKQLKTIRCLVEAGADPSALSSKGIPVWMIGWTELYQNQPDFINSGYCCPKAITLLIQLGMNFTQRCSILGRTLLHHMTGPANTDDVEVVKLLLEKGADILARDNDGLTPIMVAAIGNNQVPNMRILKYLLMREEIPNIEKIKALEVAAAVLLSYEENVHLLKEAFAFLARSRSLRQSEKNNLYFQEPVYERPISGWIPTAFKPERIQRFYSEYKMKSIRIRIRVFSSISWRAVYRYLFPYIGKHIENLIRQHKFTSAPKLVGSLVETLQHLHSKNDPLFNTGILINSLNLISTEFDQMQYIGSYSYNRTLFKLASLFAGLPTYILSEDVVDCLERIVNNNGKNRCEETMPYVIGTASTKKLLPIIGLLLRIGVDPNTTDCNRNGALHVLARKWENEQIGPIARVLMHAGVRLDRINSLGQTAADVWHEKTKKEKISTNPIVCFLKFIRFWPVEWIYCELPNWLKDEPATKPKCSTRLKGEDVRNLKCSAAEVIRRQCLLGQTLPYLDKLPVSLKSFVEMH